MLKRFCLATACLCLLPGAATQAADTPTAPSVELRPQPVQDKGVWGVEYRSGDERIAQASSQAPCGLELRMPGGQFQPVAFRQFNQAQGALEFGPVQCDSLSVKMRIERLSPSLVRRSVEVTASKPQQFALRLSFAPVIDGKYASFLQEEPTPVTYDTLGGGPEYPDRRGQTFPMAAIGQPGRVFGILSDSPGRWENRCLVSIDPSGRQMAVLTGDGSPPYALRIKYDAKDAYQYQMGGWQSLTAGQTRRFDTWLFASPARSHYDVQLAAHLALANAKGWNHSALEAILRNTAYLLLRRNLMRNEGRYIFISGIGYGWKQWVSDGFYQAIALDDPEKLIESYRSIFPNRITYEDNAQYYLIWSVLVQRAGGQPRKEWVKLAYDFLRKHEHDGIYYPPPLDGAPSKKGWKTYMDVLEYDDDDAPVSNQGFHCGALLAAKELGLGTTDQDIDRAIAGYRRMYYAQGQYLPTSIKKPNQIGQDTLYGEALTYAVFGRKLLEDQQVQGHLATALRVQSPFGLRVISQADGSLLPGHSGEYVYGGSWFLCDAAAWLVGGLHGIPTAEVDRQLVQRIEKELAFVPAFHESISTVTGRPHGHILYSWNSGYWWLRREFRKRLGQTGPDPVAQAIDGKLGVLRDSQGLRLDPAKATLRPSP